MLNLDGAFFHGDTADLPASYRDSETDALTVKDSLLAKFPWAHVAVFDLASSTENLYRDKLGAAQYDAARHAVQGWRRLPFFIRWLLRRPPDPR